MCVMTWSQRPAGAACVSSSALSTKWNCTRTLPEVPQNLVPFKEHNNVCQTGSVDLVIHVVPESTKNAFFFCPKKQVNIWSNIWRQVCSHAAHTSKTKWKVKIQYDISRGETKMKSYANLIPSKRISTKADIFIVDPTDQLYQWRPSVKLPSQQAANLNGNSLVNSFHSRRFLQCFWPLRLKNEPPEAPPLPSLFLICNSILPL